MALPVVGAFVLNAVGYYLAERASGVGEAGSLVASMPITALVYAYAFSVATLVSGRFHARRKRHLGGSRIAFAGALAGLLGMPLFLILGGAPGVAITEDGCWGEMALFASWGVCVACGG
jgi:hypothetical protein